MCGLTDDKLAFQHKLSHRHLREVNAVKQDLDAVIADQPDRRWNFYTCLQQRVHRADGDGVTAADKRVKAHALRKQLFGGVIRK